MSLYFHYGATVPYIDAEANGLRVGLMNPSCCQAVETWQLAPGKHAQQGDFHCIESDSYRLGATCIQVDPTNLCDTTEALYRQMLTHDPALSFYRIWHFIPHINAVPDTEIENYRAFCKGRATAFEKHASPALATNIPAASAVGTGGTHLTLVYLAGRAAGTAIENPRQTPAYQYPQEYGPKPPTFARATRAVFNGKPTLFISGTASILASESVGHNIETQLATTLENLHLLSAQTGVTHKGSRQVRTYLRHAHDFDYVKHQLEREYLSAADESHYIVADICRKELLVEIEVLISL